MTRLTPALAVRDVSASLRFYTDVLGFESLFTLPGEDGSLVHASVGRGDASLMFGKLETHVADDQSPLGRGVVLYFTVDDAEDIDGFFERVRDAGAKVVQEPQDQFWGHRDWAIADPDDYQIQFSKVTRSVSPEEMREAVTAAR